MILNSVSSLNATQYAVWIVTISALVLMRQKIHDELVILNSWPNSFDYIIIGAGTAGSIVARRLAEDSRNFKVLLLEAGGPETIISDMPAMTPELLGSEMDWSYKTIPQEWACFGYTENRCPIPRGKVLGGSSVLSSMNFIRGHPKDFESWLHDYGATGWSWDQVLPYFLKSENNTDLLFSMDTKHHSTSGPQVISTPAKIPEIFQSWLRANIDGGYNVIDLNGDKPIGVSMAQKYSFAGKRISAATAFLQPVRSRPNLHIIGKAHVTQILFNNKTNPRRATGIKFYRNDKYFTVKATKEIIVSAGAVNTPHLLMLSGIGPKEHLQQMGIKTIIDLPVGENLHDHIGGYGLHFIINDTYSDDLMSLNNLYNWFTSGSGPLSELNNAITMVKSKLNAHKDWPDIRLEATVRSLPLNYSTFLKNIGFSETIWENSYSPYGGLKYFSIHPIVVRPKSRGRVYLESSNPFVAPTIDPQYLSNPYDITVLLEGMKEAVRLTLSSDFLQSVSMFTTPIPGCHACTPESLHQMHSHLIPTLENSNLISCDEYLACVARVLTKVGNNLVGTCRMGLKSDVKSVVDPKLKVIKAEGLRIIDASVIPSITTGDVNAVVAMIAERGSQFILDETESSPPLGLPFGAASTKTFTKTRCHQFSGTDINPYNFQEFVKNNYDHKNKEHPITQYLNWLKNAKISCGL